MAARITRMTKRRLGELLQAEGLVTEEQVKNALAEQRKESLFLSEALIRLGYVTDQSIASTIAQQFNLPFLALEQCEIPTEHLTIFPQSLLREYQFIPFDKMGDTVLIAGAGLMNHDMLNELERIGGCKVCQYVSTWFDIRNEIDRLFEDEEVVVSQDELSDLGSMLLDDDDNMDSGSGTGMDPEDEIAAAVDALTGGSTTDVLQEALAAVESPGRGDGSTPLGAPPPVDPSPTGSNPPTPLGTGGKMSAFAKPGSSKKNASG